VGGASGHAMSTKVQLLEDGVPGHQAAQVRRALHLGPWCWPTSAVGSARAAELAGTRPAPIGSALVVTEAGSAAALYVYRPDNQDGGVSMSSDGRTAVACARALLGHSCGALRELPITNPSTRLQLLDKHIVAGESPDTSSVRGDSLGVAVLLAQASACLRLPLPEDLVALCSLGENGETRAVFGIQRKLEALAACAPRVRRFLVAPPNEDDAREACERLGYPREAAVVVEAASDAITAAFGDDLPRQMVDSLAPGGRDQFVDQLLTRALDQKRDLLLSWRPIWQIADAALEAWPDGERVHELRLVHAIAVRHDNAAIAERIEEDWAGFADWVADLPRLRRFVVLAHVVQQNTDRRVPSDERLDALLAALRPEQSDSANYAKLRGAEGRRAAVQGRYEDAWTCQLEAFELLLEGTHTQLSFQLSALYQIAGVLRDPDRVDQVDRLAASAEDHGRLRAAGDRYVRLARSRAQVQAGCSEERTAGELRQIAADGGAPGHVRASALVWLAIADSWNEERFEDEYQGLEATMKGEDSSLCLGFPALWRILRGPASGVLGAFEDLWQHESLVVASMLSVSPDQIPTVSVEEARDIAWRFPY